jgi:hypothetical protein
MSDLFRKTVPVWLCPDCHRSTIAPVEDTYGYVFCPEPDCNAELHHCVARDATWVTVAVYSVGRGYGGPEEGGWWYDIGSLIPGTQRSFTDEDQPQAEVYRDAMLHRYARDDDWRTRGDERFVVRVYYESNAPGGYPSVQPRYC